MPYAMWAMSCGTQGITGEDGPLGEKGDLGDIVGCVCSS